MQNIRLLLLPISFLWSLILRARHWAYDAGLIASAGKFPVPVICIGNLELGGTGKTPMTEFLIRNLKEEYKIGVVSRGYGRKTKGFVLLRDGLTPLETGDEPWQIYKKFGSDIRMAVCEDRTTGINKLLQLAPDRNLIILDDAYQHRKINADVNILLTSDDKPFTENFLLPAGTLRDVVSAANRAHIIVRTKSTRPFDPEETEQLQKQVPPVFVSRISYIPFHIPEQPADIMVVTGIAKAAPLISHLKARHRILKHLNYSDHYKYTAENLRQIHEIFDNFACPGAKIVTTEKDFTKIGPLLPENRRHLWLVQEIGTEMSGGNDAFLTCLRDKLNIHERLR